SGFSSAAVWLAPLLALADAVQAGSGDVGELLAGLEQASVQGGGGFNWGGLVGNGLMVMMIPLCRMRLLDMGKTVRRAWVWAVFINVSAVSALLAVLGLPGVPLGWMFKLLSFGGYIWLCVAPSAPRV